MMLMTPDIAVSAPVPMSPKPMNRRRRGSSFIGAVLDPGAERREPITRSQELRFGEAGRNKGWVASTRVCLGCLADASAGRCDAKKFHDVPEIVVALGTELLLDVPKRAVQLGGGFRVEFIHTIGGLADDMVAGGLAEIDLLKRGAVVKEGAPHEADVLECRHAAVNRHEIARAGSKLVMQIFNSDGLGLLGKFGQNREAWLRDAQARRLQLRGRKLDGRLRFAAGFPAGERVVRLG